MPITDAETSASAAAPDILTYTPPGAPAKGADVLANAAAVVDTTAATLPAQRPGTTGPAPRQPREVVPPTVLPVDEYTGKGGDYVIGEDGVRRPAPAV